MQDRRVKGEASILSSNGWLQIRYQYQGQRKYFALGLKDNPENRALAEDKARWISSDIRNDRFDETLEKYKSKAQLKLIKTDTSSEQSMVELWQKYLEYKRPRLSPNTMKNQMAAVTSHLNRLPKGKVGDAIDIRDWLIANLSPDAARRTLMQCSACCRWAVRSQLITENPFRNFAVEIKVRKPKPEDIDPFTKEEQLAIIAAFDKTPYGPFVRFLLLTGCRTGEARGLKWKHVRRTTIVFAEALSATGDTTDTKTHTSRQFPINRQLQSLLESVKPSKKPDPEAYVFTSVEGTIRTFQSQWQKIVSDLVIEGRVERYRAQYNTRHSAITNFLEAGITIPQISRWVGNSPEIIMKHYAGTVRSVQVPEINFFEEVSRES